MTELRSKESQQEISRDRLAELLNEDLSREYQAVISYVVYSQVLKGAEYTDIAAQLEIHAKQEAMPSRALMCCPRCCNPPLRAGRVHSWQRRPRAGSGSPASSWGPAVRW